uniref:C2H2-type domain-containing protein n=1 Tax=Trichogramma kaykai TaxID=54128 RepID=A0ABD2WWM9_9HYME
MKPSKLCSTEQRIIIELCHQNGQNVEETLQELQRRFGENAAGRTQVYQWYTRCSAGEPWIPDCDTPSNDPEVERLRLMLLEDKRLSVSQLCDRLALSRDRVEAILRDELRVVRCVGKFVTEQLGQHEKLWRLGACKKLRERRSNDPDFLDKIVTGDEVVLYAENGSDEAPVKTTLIVFFAKRGIVYYEFLPQGETLTAIYYCEVIKRLSLRIGDRRKWILHHHEDTNAHSSPKLQEYLKKKNVDVLSYTPNSPDLAPCDIFLIPKLKQGLKRVQLQTVKQLQKKIIQIINNIKLTEFVNGFNQWQEIWDQCINIKGDYFCDEQNENSNISDIHSPKSLSNVNSNASIVDPLEQCINQNIINENIAPSTSDLTCDQIDLSIDKNQFSPSNSAIKFELQYFVSDNSNKVTKYLEGQNNLKVEIQCPQCQIKFQSSKSIYKTHIESCRGIFYLKCMDCSYVTINIDNMKHHLFNKHEQEDAADEILNKMIETSPRLFYNCQNKINYSYKGFNKLDLQEVMDLYCSNCNITYIEQKTIQHCVKCQSLLKNRCMNCKKHLEDCPSSTTHLNIGCYPNLNQEDKNLENISCTECKCIFVNNYHFNMHFKNNCKVDSQPTLANTCLSESEEDFLTDDPSPAKKIKLLKYCMRCSAIYDHNGLRKCLKCRDIPLINIYKLCPQCKKIFQDKDHFAKHVLRCTWTGPIYACGLCKYEGYILLDLKEHIMNSHQGTCVNNISPKKDSNTSSKVEFTTSISSPKSENGSKTFFKCTHCNAIMSSLKLFQDHLFNKCNPNFFKSRPTFNIPIAQLNCGQKVKHKNDKIEK